jgi:hypothetical protein
MNRLSDWRDCCFKGVSAAFGCKPCLGTAAAAACQQELLEDGGGGGGKQQGGGEELEEQQFMLQNVSFPA